MKRIAVMGGDIRQKHLTELLRQEGFEAMYLFGENEITAQSLHTIMPNIDTVILPLPVSRDGISLNAPMHNKTVLLSELFLHFQGKDIFGGFVGENVHYTATKSGIKITDYFDREELTVKNAVATAEGALNIAISNTPFTISGSRCLVIGYGRIGKILSRMLDQMGAVVSASARKAKDLAWIEASGLDSIETKYIGDILSQCDIVFNTVPFKVLGAAELACCKKEVLIIDLASSPGGVDTTTAKRLNIKVINAPGLPGKIAPLSAAKYIKDTLLNIFREEKE